MKFVKQIFKFSIEKTVFPTDLDFCLTSFTYFTEFVFPFLY